MIEYRFADFAKSSFYKGIKSRNAGLLMVQNKTDYIFAGKGNNKTRFEAPIYYLK